MTAMRPAKPTLWLPERRDGAGKGLRAVEEERQLGAAAGERGHRRRWPTAHRRRPCRRRRRRGCAASCRPDWRTAARLGPSALLICATTDADAAGEIEADDPCRRDSAWQSSGSGSALGSSTRTSVTVRCVLVRRVGVGETDRVAGEQRSDVDVEPGLRADGRPRCRRSCGRTARATSRRRSRRAAPAPRPAPGRASRAGGDLARADHLVRRSGRSPAAGPVRAGSCRPSVCVGSAFHCEVAVIEPLASKTSVAARSPTSCMPGAGEHRDLVVVGLDDLDVHQLRELVDIVVALVVQRGGGGVLRRWSGRAAG